MRFFFNKEVNGHIVFLGMGVVWLWLLVRNPDIPITYRFSTEPLPDQRFARTIFYIAGIVLVLGGLWGLWIDWYAGP